jgi:hypothetical protein
MLKFNSILLVLGLLAVASALNANLIKSMFFVPINNTLSYNGFQNGRGIHTYGIPYQGQVPTHQLIDLKSNTATPILANLVSACDYGHSSISRLHYHVPTLTLVYYCLTNNSLLILNDGDYSVKSSIPVTISGRFDEVKLSTDGYAVAAVAIGSLEGSSPTPSHLISFDLQKQQIINHVTFDHDLAPGEVITRYAATPKASYVMSFSKQDSSITVYAVTMIGSSYKLDVFYHTAVQNTQVVSELFCVADNVLVSYDDAFVILNQQGRVAQGYSSLQSKYNGGSKALPIYTALVADPASPDFYALFSNQTLTKFSVKLTGIVHSVLSTTTLDMQFIPSDPMHNTLLFTIDSGSELLIITDLVANQKIYQFTAGFDNFMLTDSYLVAYKKNQTSPYGPFFAYFERSSYWNVFTSGTGNSRQYYYNQEQATISYLVASKTLGTCQVYQLNLNFSSLSSYLVIKDFSACQGELTHAMNIDSKTLQVTVHKVDSKGVDSYTIVSQSLGEVTFTPPSNYGDQKALVADYDTLSLHYLVQSFQYQNTTVSQYQYDAQSKQFNLGNTAVFADVHASQYVILNQQQIAAFVFQDFTVIDLPSLTTKHYTYSSYWDNLSSFKDQNGNSLFILSNPSDGTLFNKAAGFIDSTGNVGLLPGSVNNTISAGPAGPCQYWLVNYDQFVPSVATVQFYDVCGGSRDSGVMKIDI